MKNLILLVLLLVFSTSFGQNINQYDEKGKRHGKWTKFFEGTKKVRYEGQFEHGKEVGTFKFYHKDAKGKHPTLIKEFVLNSDVANLKYYTSNGKLIQEGKMNGKIRIGEWKFYDKKANIVTEIEHYKNGKLEGQKLSYYINGKILQKEFYKAGVLDGKHQVFAENGQMLKDLNYRNGKLNGPFCHYDANGKLKLQGKYYNSRPVGEWKYYEDGEIIKTKDYTKAKNQNKYKD